MSYVPYVKKIFQTNRKKQTKLQKKNVVNNARVNRALTSDMSDSRRCRETINLIHTMIAVRVRNVFSKFK